MLGAIIGDVAGSLFEFNDARTMDIPIMPVGSDFTDDSVCTFAVAHGIARDYDPINSLRIWCRKYAMRGYGPHFHAWFNSNHRFTQDSYGNGAVMRISPVALFAKDMDEAEALSNKWTSPSHNHPISLNSARTLCRILLRLRNGDGKEALIEEAEFVGLEIKSCQEYFDIGGYHIEADKTLARAIACVLESESFEEVLRKVIWIGSDTDTTAAVAGPMAEFLFGIPEKLVDRVVDVFGVEHHALLKDLASLYKDSLIGEKPWTNRILGHVMVDYTKMGSNDIFGNESIPGVMKVSFTSHATLDLAKKKPNVGVIRIGDDEYFGSIHGWGMFKTISFYDVDNYQLSLMEKLITDLPLSQKWMEKIFKKKSAHYPWRPMCKCDAIKIAEWIRQAKSLGLDELVFCCNYGKSRSAGAAKAAAEHVGYELDPPKHNDRVYRLVKEALAKN